MTTNTSTTVEVPAADTEVAIAVMGATGSGKTTFLNLVSGSNLRIGRGLRSCTSVVQLALPFELDGRQVTLIDTPGFDDTDRSDADILKMIAMFLSTTYEQGKKLAGVIYFHRISDFRVGGISRRNFKMFRELCGDSSLKNVAIVTNMWGEVSLEVGEAREDELATEDMFFKPALDKQAQLLRHNNTLESAQAVIRSLIKNKPLALRIQRELVDQHKTILETAAGAELNRELVEQARKHREEMEKLQKEMQAAIKERDEETRREIEEEQKKLQERMEKIQCDSEKLASDFGEDRAKLESKIRETMGQTERAEAAHRKEVAELQSQLNQTTVMTEMEKTSILLQLEDLRRTNDSRHLGGIFQQIGHALDQLFSSLIL